jgi:prepilin-type N-terminal cleavage/methylation domain-containing protein
MELEAVSARERHVLRDRAGFTMIEMMAVIVIAGILAGLAINPARRYLEERDAANARNAFTYLSVRARSAAIERGQVARLQIDPVGDRAWIVMGRSGAGDTLDPVVRFAAEYRTDVVIPGNQLLTICYSPRGIALASGFGAGSCGGGVAGSTMYVDFQRGNSTVRATVRPLGQVLSQ